MIEISYKCTCDFCGKETSTKQILCPGDVVFTPTILKPISIFWACSECIDNAWAFLVNRENKND